MILFLFMSISAWALPAGSWQAAAVKISSFPCLTETPRLQGSGLAFSVKGSTYVVTSEHVVIHSNAREICHEVGGRPLELVSADFAAGLALLRSAEAISGAVSLAELQNQGTAATWTALGFPAGSDDLATLTEGKLLTSASRRALIAGQPALLELAGLPVEYGMSGGIILAGENFGGILSHQVLKREAGKPTRPGDVEPGPGSQNDLALAIPGPAVASWIERQLAGTRAEWVRESSLQVKGEPALRHGVLLFSLKNGKAGDVWDIGGVDWGGSDGSGIGGGDEGDPAGESISYIEMGFAPGATPAEKSKVLDDPAMNQWREWLLSGKKVRLVFLKNPAVKRLSRILSLSQFLTYWQRDGHSPIAIRSRNGGGQGDGEILLQRARAMEALAQAARDRATSIEMKAWFALHRDQGVMAENLLVSSKEILGLLQGENDRYWREYYDMDFDSAVALEGAIQSLVEQMRKMGL